MKRLIAILAFILAFSAPAFSQAIIVTSCGTVPASVATLTAGKQSGYFMDVNGVLCTSTGGGTLPTGAATAALQTTGNTTLGTINTTLGSPFQAGGTLGAGSAIIGKVGIDQTTPGTTNLVYVLGSRPFYLSSPPGAASGVPNGQTAYTVTTGPLNIGGLITVATGLPSGTILTAVTIRLKVLNSNLTTIGTQLFATFTANPTASTITDNTVLAINSADVDKTFTFGSIAATGANTGGVANWSSVPTRIKVDGSGNIYFAFVALTTTVFAATNVIGYEIDGLY